MTFFHTVQTFQVFLYKSHNLAPIIFAHSFGVISFLNELELICLNSSIAVGSTLVNGFSYCYLTLILFDIKSLFADSEVVTSIAIKYQ